MIRKIINFPCWIYNIILLHIKRIKTNKITINGFLHLHGRGQIEIGNNVKINSSQDANPSSGFDRTHISVQKNAKLVIGNNVGISNCSISVAELVEIHDNVMIGSGSMIADTDFHSLNLYERINGNTNAKRKPVIICQGAFIGARSIILKGVTIGKNSIIGAGSVVAKDIPENEIWAGNPVKFIRKIEE